MGPSVLVNLNQLFLAKLQGLTWVNSSALVNQILLFLCEVLGCVL